VKRQAKKERVGDEEVLELPSQCGSQPLSCGLHSALKSRIILT